jgi:hypothetical protein
MRRKHALLILLVSIAAGLIFIAYNSYLAYNIFFGEHRDTAFKANFAYFGVGVVLILSGWYIYVLLTRIEQLQISQDEPNADYMALHRENEKIQSDLSRLQKENDQRELSQSKFPKICDIENDRILPQLGSEEFHIMQNLFQDDYRIRVAPIMGGYGNFGVYHVIPETVEGEALKPGFVVKYLTFRDIRREKNVYQTVLRKYPLGYSPGRPIRNWPPDDQLAANGRMGAVSYELAQLNPDSQLRTLRDLYKQLSYKEFVPYLELLLERLDRWYVLRLPPAGNPPLGGPNGIYERLYRKRDDIQKGISRLLRASSMDGESARPPDALTAKAIELPFLPEDWKINEVFNPIYWIDQVLAPGQAKCFNAVSPYSPVHGDLYTGNVLIESGRETQIWLIDFPNAHIGPSLQDFATMEADVKLNLIDMEQCSIGDWLRFEQQLLVPLSEGYQTLDWPWSQDWQPKGGELLKAWKVIRFLRRSARERRLIGDDVCGYYLALLHNTLPAVYRDAHTDLQKQCALTSAAWMCGHLGPNSETSKTTDNQTSH